MSSVSADDLFSECQHLDQPFFYQLYVHPDRSVCDSFSFSAFLCVPTVVIARYSLPIVRRRSVLRSHTSLITRGGNEH